MRVRVIFVVSGRRHFCFLFLFLFLFYCFILLFLFGVFDEMLVAWLLGILMMMMMMMRRGLVGCRMTCALGYLSLLLSSELCHYEDTSASASLHPERHVLYSNELCSDEMGSFHFRSSKKVPAHLSLKTSWAQNSSKAFSHSQVVSMNFSSMTAPVPCKRPPCWVAFPKIAPT